MNKVIISWDEYHKDVRKLAQQLKAKNYTKLLAVTRGGLFPTSILASELGIRIIDTICIASYVQDSQSKAKILKQPTIDLKDTLIVDDLSDTGNTARLIHELFPDTDFACVYTKPLGQKYAPTYVKEFAQDQWIVQPWEVGEEGLLD